MKFLDNLAALVNSGQSRTVILTGNVYDLFWDAQVKKYVPLMSLVLSRFKKSPVMPNVGEGKPGTRGIAQIVYAVNRPVEVIGDEPLKSLSVLWAGTHGFEEKRLEERLGESGRNSAYGLELMRQMAEGNRKTPKTSYDLLMVVEAADMLLPESEIGKINELDRRRVAVAHDWFSDPDWLHGHDTAILIAESRSLIHSRVSKLPQVLSIEIPLPDLEERREFIVHWVDNNKHPYAKMVVRDVAEQSSGLSLHALRQLLCSGDLSPYAISKKVEEYMISQLGEGVVEFSRPIQRIADVVGNRHNKVFMMGDLKDAILSADPDDAIAGVLFGGPVGGGKTFIVDALFGELGIPVIGLKAIRSMWYGGTDLTLDRLRRLLMTFHRIGIRVDEADTMFGGVDSDHETEKRLTGKIQEMMSDPALLGKVVWCLMTARLHRLSPDIRRNGRMDYIVPILDPEGEDFDDFVRWAFGDCCPVEAQEWHDVRFELKGYSAGAFSTLRKQIRRKKCNDVAGALAVAKDLIPPDIEETREYQTLQAKINCTYRPLLPELADPNIDHRALRKQWKARLRELESMGVN